jgi:hypothetical protein
MRAFFGAAALLAGLTFAGSAYAATDTVAPETTITPLAGGAFRFDANESATFSCRLDGGPAKPCSEPLGVIPYGSHVLEATATDDAGNVDPTPAVYRWTSTAPPVENPTPIVTPFTPEATPSVRADELAPAQPLPATPLRVRYTFKDGRFTRIWLSNGAAKITVKRPGRSAAGMTLGRLVGQKLANGTKITFSVGGASKTLRVRGGRLR